mmetsp:Transcript_25973/g.64908  ORF Transcript_25973/g.64908 Transcript_25973/m.64908 type:complete len:200 (-) Transcript_25973:1874-2473(-)
MSSSDASSAQTLPRPSSGRMSTAPTALKRSATRGDSRSSRSSRRSLPRCRPSSKNPSNRAPRKFGRSPTTHLRNSGTPSTFASATSRTSCWPSPRTPPTSACTSRRGRPRFRTKAPRRSVPLLGGCTCWSARTAAGPTSLRRSRSPRTACWGSGGRTWTLLATRCSESWCGSPRPSPRRPPATARGSLSSRLSCSRDTC